MACFERLQAYEAPRQRRRCGFQGQALALGQDDVVGQKAMMRLLWVGEVDNPPVRPASTCEWSSVKWRVAGGWATLDLPLLPRRPEPSG